MTIQAHPTGDIDRFSVGALHIVSAGLRRTLHLIGRGVNEGINKLTAEWPERISQRRKLAQLGDRELADFGASRADAWVEASKPFWRK